MADSTVPAKGNPIALTTGGQDNGLVLSETSQDNALVREWVRDAVDDRGWKHDAVAAAISEASGRSIDGPYFSKMLTGEKPFPIELLRALPDDIEQDVARRYAEAMGLIVVEPVHGQDAVRSLISGLIGVLSAPLPMRMATATLRPTTATRKVAP